MDFSLFAGLPALCRIADQSFISPLLKFVLQRKQGFLFSVGMSVAHTDRNIPDELPGNLHPHHGVLYPVFPQLDRDPSHWRFTKHLIGRASENGLNFCHIGQRLKELCSCNAGLASIRFGKFSGLLAVFLPSLGHNNPSFDRRDQTVPVAAFSAASCAHF